VASLLITIYAFIPAVFSSAIPISKISPITLMLSYISGEMPGVEDVVLSFSHILVMSGLLLYFSTKAVTPDVAYSRSILWKLMSISRRVAATPLRSFGFAALSIPFAFMAEFILLILLFTLPKNAAIPALILSVAVVEETIKGLVISARPTYVNAIATAVGFFAGEKALLVFSLIREHSVAFLGQFLVLPLLLHLLTSLLFVLMRGYGFSRSYAAAVAVHAAYNYAVVTLLAA